MSKRESFKVTEEEYKQVQRMKQIDKENTQRNRELTIRKHTNTITQYGRMIADKRDQIEKNDFRESSDSFVDKKKPAFMLLNEIDELNGVIETTKEANKAINEEYEKAKG